MMTVFGLYCLSYLSLIWIAISVIWGIKFICVGPFIVSIKHGQPSFSIVASAGASGSIIYKEKYFGIDYGIWNSAK